MRTEYRCCQGTRVANPLLLEGKSRATHNRKELKSGPDKLELLANYKAVCLAGFDLARGVASWSSFQAIAGRACQ